MHSLGRLIGTLVCLGGMMGAIGAPVAPGTPPAADAAPAWQFTPATRYADITWDGRKMNLLEVGIAAQSPQQIAFGAFVRNTAGHGRSGATHYDGNGWQAYGEVPLLAAKARRPSLTIYVEHTRDAVELSVVDEDSNSHAWPIAMTSGVELRAAYTPGIVTWRGRSGIYQSTVNAEHLANIVVLGGAFEQPLLRSLRGCLELTAYHESYENGQTSIELGGTLTYYQSDRGRISLGGRYYPRGVPMGGTPFSSTSSIGLVYGGDSASQLRSSPMGYLTLEGALTF